jgi:hypothetical protein
MVAGLTFGLDDVDGKRRFKDSRSTGMFPDRHATEISADLFFGSESASTRWCFSVTVNGERRRR